MGKPWDLDTPVQVLFKQVEDGVKYARLAGVVIQDKEKIATGYNLIHKTGELSAACRDWRKKSESAKTWSTFKSHFTAEYQDYKDETKEVGTTMFKAQQVMQDSYNQVLNQVKEEAEKDEETIKELQYQNAELLCQMSKKSEETTELKSIIKDMQQLVTKLGGIVSTANKDSSPKIEAHYAYC